MNMPPMESVKPMSDAAMRRACFEGLLSRAGGEPMTKGAKYTKIVEWSDEDNCFIGTCPELMYGGSHGDDATKVFIELCEMVDEAIETLEEAGKPVPQPFSQHELGAFLQKRA
jgi:predicted RNase H-like HicB family nuclease